MNSTPRWIPFLFGGVMLLMGALILGAFLGIVPTNGGQFFAPPLIILALGVGMVLGGFLLWIPQQAPAWMRASLFVLLLALVAVVCNWTAFAPDVVYSSTTSIGPVSFSGEAPLGGRIVFGIAALVVDAFILFAIISWARSGFKWKE